MDSEYDWSELEREIQSALNVSDPDPYTHVRYVEAHLYDVQGDLASGEIHGETYGPYGEEGSIFFNFVYNRRTKRFI